MTQPRASELRFQGKQGTFPAALAVLWFLWVYFRYFKRPIDLQSVTAILEVPPGTTRTSLSAFVSIWGESLLVFVLAILVLSALIEFGSFITRFLGIGPNHAVVRFPFRLGFGIAGANILWMGLGLTGLWQKPLLCLAWAVLLIPALTFFIGKKFSGLRMEVAEWLHPIRNFSWFARLLSAVTAVYLLFSICQGLVPETFYDSMVYHLAVPSYWILHHGVCDFPTNFFSNYPYGGEMVFMNGFLWSPVFGSQAAKMLNILCLAAAALTAGTWVKDIVTGQEAGLLARPEAGPDARESGLLAGAMLFTTPLLTMNVWSTQLEGVLVLFMLLFLRLWCETTLPEGIRFVAAGILGGMVLSVKYTAVLGIGAGVLSLLMLQGIRNGWSKRWWWMGLAALPWVMPWVLKNYLFTGNPFYPYLMDWFSGRHLPPESYARLLSEQREMHVDQWYSWFLLPWRLTMQEPVGPLLLGLVPGLFLFKMRHRALKFLAYTVVFFFAVSLSVTHHMRFLLVGFALSYIVAAAALSGAAGWVRKSMLLVTALSALLSFPTLANISRRYYSCGGILRGVETRKSYLARAGVSPYFELADWVNRNLPADAVILVAGDARGLYYSRPFITNTVFDDPFLAKAAQDGLEADGMLRRLKELGVTHLAVNGEEGLRSAADYRHYELSSDEWRRLDDFMRRAVEPLVSLRLKTVYRLREEPADKPVLAPSHLLFLFSATGTRFLQMANREEWTSALSLADEALALCPWSSFWWEQKAQVVSRLGRESEALVLFRKAGAVGILQVDGYRQWIRLLEKGNHRRDAETIRGSARRWYPTLF